MEDLPAAAALNAVILLFQLLGLPRGHDAYFSPALRTRHDGTPQIIMQDHPAVADGALHGYGHTALSREWTGFARPNRVPSERGSFPANRKTRPPPDPVAVDRRPQSPIEKGGNKFRFSMSIGFL
jgi:hypothetical protein